MQEWLKETLFNVFVGVLVIIILYLAYRYVYLDYIAMATKYGIRW